MLSGIPKSVTQINSNKRKFKGIEILKMSGIIVKYLSSKVYKSDTQLRIRRLDIWGQIDTFKLFLFEKVKNF